MSSGFVAEEFPLILTTGGRLYPFYHSAWTNIPMQRELEPYPFVEVHPETAKAAQISDGEWVFVESPRGRIRVKALVTKAINPRVVHVPRPGWRDSCKELGLPELPPEFVPPQIVGDVGANPAQYGNQGILLNSEGLKNWLFGPLDGPPRNTSQIGQPG